MSYEIGVLRVGFRVWQRDRQRTTARNAKRETPDPAFAMKRSLRWLGRALLVLLVVLLGLVLARDEIAKVLAKRTLQESTGLRAEIGLGLRFIPDAGPQALQPRPVWGNTHGQRAGVGG
ncbi:MAG: hypothetical protein DME25_22175 [Verrucomicrobia bacterium]|nr:MAG: hypothetical protein DME25_22175 [Verrucomicrobiota bacterium]